MALPQRKRNRGAPGSMPFRCLAKMRHTQVGHHLNRTAFHRSGPSRTTTSGPFFESRVIRPERGPKLPGSGLVDNGGSHFGASGRRRNP